MRTLSIIALLLLSACAPTSPSGNAPGEKIVVATTMSTLASLVQYVAGDRAQVVNLVPVGVSPEDYQPRPKDIAFLAKARILVENGAGLEGWLAHTVDAAKNPNLRILVCTDGMAVIGNNPHLWMNPAYAKVYIDKIYHTLAATDPAGKAQYAANANHAKASMDVLDAWIRSQIATVPPAHRNMIVFHNAWQYYNDRYGLKTVGAIELSPGQEPSPQYIGQLIATANQNHVRAVFAEPEYSPRLAKALAQDAGITVVTNLYDDSIADAGPVRDYNSMLRYDTQTIVSALR